MCGPEPDGQTLQPGRGAPLILAASPREGNSLLAALEFCRGMDDALSAAPPPQGSPEPCAPDKQGSPEQYSPVQLRRYRVLPCLDCGACESRAARISPEAYLADPAALCPLSGQDDSRSLLNALSAAPLVVICAPIYFYHLPAQLKALLDRCQIFHRAAESPALGPLLRSPPYGRNGQTGQHEFIGRDGNNSRPLFALLLGARSRGEKLFSGSLLSLKYALAPLGFVPQPPLLLYGLDRAADLAGNPAVMETVREYGRQAMRHGKP